ncbi:MAG TPA: hypothetical protein VGK71_04805 [Nitrospirota bacterium]
MLLQWQAVKGATDYKVFRSEVVGKEGKVIATVKNNRHIDKGVPGGKNLYYIIKAVVGGKDSESSQQLSVQTPSEKVFVALKAPKLIAGHVKEQADGTSTVTLRWEGAVGSNLIGINIYRSSQKGKGYALMGSTSSDTFTDKDVAAGQNYYYVVTSVDDQFNETKYSNEVAIAIPAKSVAKKAEEEAKAVPATKMRLTKFLFSIPLANASEKEKRDFVPKNAQDVAVDEAIGHIYVASYDTGSVLVYNLKGELQFYIKKDGVGGKDRFTAPTCVTLGKNGEIYVPDYVGANVYVYDFSGKPLDTIKLEVLEKGSVARAFSVVMSEDGKLYVGDPGSNAIRVYRGQPGKFKHAFDIVPSRKPKLGFNGTAHLTLSKSGDLIFIDTMNARLQDYTANGEFKGVISSKGTSAGQLSYPTGIATAKSGDILVSSGMSPNIQAFSEDGKFLYALANDKGDGPMAVGDMRGIAIDSGNRIYISEGNNNSVSVFQITDNYTEIVPK